MSEGPSDDRSDDLSSSPSETVRRHASAFKRDWGEGAAVERAGRGSRGGYVDGTAADVSGDGLRVLGARSAGKVAAEATAAGWRVVGRFASHRRESDGAPIDAAVVMAAWVEPGGGVRHWGMGHWRTDPIAPPMKRTWKFTGATVADPERGVRAVGAKELTAKISSPMAYALECEQTQSAHRLTALRSEGGEGSHGEGRG